MTETESIVSYLIDRTSATSVWGRRIRESNEHLYYMLEQLNEFNKKRDLTAEQHMDNHYLFSQACSEMDMPRNKELREVVAKNIYGKDRFGGML